MQADDEATATAPVARSGGGPAVIVRGLAKAYGDTRALDDVSFEVGKGECLAVLGPNGAGKTTLFSILATMSRPDSGDAFIAGSSVVDEPDAVRRAIGVAFQEPVVSKHLTAREVLLHHAALYAVPRHERAQRAEELIAFTGLEERATDKVRTFSGGMKRKLDLARVLMTEPKVLLLDEPTTGLDIRAKADLQDRLRALTQGGTTILLATHDLHEAERLAARVAILDRGHLLACDAPRALVSRLGRRIVHVRVQADLGTKLREAVGVLKGLGEVVETGDGIEVLLPEAGEGVATITPGAVVDALEHADLSYERVTVREPDLGDVFLGLTGRQLPEVERA